MWSNKDIPFNHHFSVVCRSSWSGVKVRDNGGSDSDCAIVPDCYVRGMQFINVHKLTNPDVLANHHSAQPLQPRSRTESPGGHKSDPTRKPTQQNWQDQRFPPLPYVSNAENCTCVTARLIGARIAFAQYSHG
jgi:hypothetical protein